MPKKKLIMQYPRTTDEALQLLKWVVPYIEEGFIEGPTVSIRNVGDKVVLTCGIKAGSPPQADPEKFFSLDITLKLVEA